MEQRKELSEQEQKRLLKEYALCQEAAHSLESTIWQTSAAVGIGSTGSFILTAHGQLNWFVAAIAGGMIIAVNCIWWRMARRWWSIQHAHFLRMRHIEDLMALYQVRYVDYLDALRAPTSKETADDLGARLLPARAQVQKDLGEDPTSGLAKRHQREGVQAKLQWLLVVNGAAWILYVMYLFCLWVVSLAC